MKRRLHMKWRLRVARDMSDDSLEDLRLVGRGAHVSVEVLELDLLAPEVVAEAMELAALVLFPILAVKGMPFDALPHQGGVFIQDAPHGERRCNW